MLELIIGIISLILGIFGAIPGLRVLFHRTNSLRIGNKKEKHVTKSLSFEVEWVEFEKLFSEASEGPRQLSFEFEETDSKAPSKDSPNPFEGSDLPRILQSLLSLSDDDEFEDFREELEDHLEMGFRRREEINISKGDYVVKQAIDISVSIGKSRLRRIISRLIPRRKATK